MSTVPWHCSISVNRCRTVMNHPFSTQTRLVLTIPSVQAQLRSSLTSPQFPCPQTYRLPVQLCMAPNVSRENRSALTQFGVLRLWSVPDVRLTSPWVQIVYWWNPLGIPWTVFQAAIRLSICLVSYFCLRFHFSCDGLLAFWDFLSGLKSSWCYSFPVRARLFTVFVWLFCVLRANCNDITWWSCFDGYHRMFMK